MKEVLILRDLECIKAIAHPRRIDVLRAFNNEPLSAKQLSQMLDEPHAKINYHIKTLYKVGILELVEEKIKSGIVEKYYYPKAKNILIDKNVINIYLEEKKGEKYISKVDDIIDLFYKAVKNQVLEEENIINYNDICLNNDEIIELNNAIKYKIEEIIQKRNKEDEGIKYDIVMVSIPISK
ncbi:MAG: helix-turn-helix transcriptional regulator [Romboutsia sp.]|nr:helix-turn-helix transcriptional regulator [Romboutsia sp.]